MQEVYWGVFSTATPVREWGKQEWARERMNCDTVATEGLGVPWKSLELSLPFEDVSNWGKATLPPTLPVIGLGWGDGLSAWGKQLFLARATPERYSAVNHQPATVPVTEGAEGEIWGGGGACTPAFTTFKEKVGSRQMLCCRYSIWEVMSGGKSEAQESEK